MNREQAHQQYLEYVVEAISTFAEWREKLFKSNFGTKFTINGDKDSKLPAHLQAIIKKHNLGFIVSKVQFAEVKGWDGYEYCTFFKVDSSDFPEIHAFSANNPLT